MAHSSKRSRQESIDRISKYSQLSLLLATTRDLAKSLGEEDISESLSQIHDTVEPLGRLGNQTPNQQAPKKQRGNASKKPNGDDDDYEPTSEDQIPDVDVYLVCIINQGLVAS